MTIPKTPDVKPGSGLVISDKYQLLITPDKVDHDHEEPTSRIKYSNGQHIVRMPNMVMTIELSPSSNDSKKNRSIAKSVAIGCILLSIGAAVVYLVKNSSKIIKHINN